MFVSFGDGGQSVLSQTRNARWCGMMMCSRGFFHQCQRINYPRWTDSLDTGKVGGNFISKWQLYFHFQVVILLLSNTIIQFFHNEWHVFFFILDASPTWIAIKFKGKSFPKEVFRWGHQRTLKMLGVVFGVRICRIGSDWFHINLKDVMFFVFLLQEFEGNDPSWWDSYHQGWREDSRWSC